MSILPTFITQNKINISTKEELPEVPAEYEIDFETGMLTGQKVEGTEAIKVWIWLCLHIERFRFPIFSWDYGTELEQYMKGEFDREYIELDAEGAVEEALKINPYITGIENFSCKEEKQKLYFSFTVITRLGNTEVNINV